MKTIKTLPKTVDKVLYFTIDKENTQHICTECVKQKFNLLNFGVVIDLHVHTADTGAKCVECGYVEPLPYVEEDEHMRLELTGVPHEPIQIQEGHYKSHYNLKTIIPRTLKRLKKAIER